MLTENPRTLTYQDSPRWSDRFIDQGDFAGKAGRVPLSDHAEVIKIGRARQYNLKNFHGEVPPEKLVVITGLSGSKNRPSSSEGMADSYGGRSVGSL
jgi:hypothetical protein